MLCERKDLNMHLLISGSFGVEDAMEKI